ncbi:MAG: hypothetical protein WBI14_04710 [Anaerolineaceae bacterium]
MSNYTDSPIDLLEDQKVTILSYVMSGLPFARLRQRILGSSAGVTYSLVTYGDDIIAD